MRAWYCTFRQAELLAQLFLFLTHWRCASSKRCFVMKPGCFSFPRIEPVQLLVELRQVWVVADGNLGWRVRGGASEARLALRRGGCGGSLKRRLELLNLGLIFRDEAAGAGSTAERCLDPLPLPLTTSFRFASPRVLRACTYSWLSWLSSSDSSGLLQTVTSASEWCRRQSKLGLEGRTGSFVPRITGVQEGDAEESRL